MLTLPLRLRHFAVCGIILLMGGAALALPSAVQADDWPQWLGPQRDSVWREDGIVDRFPEEGPHVKWRVEVDGGYAGPAVADGRVYVMDYVTDGDRTPSPSRVNELEGQERVLCFDGETGEPIWEHAYDSAYKVSYPSGPRATPTVDGDRIYTLGTMGELRCLNADDGEMIWRRNFPDEYGAPVPIWGFCGHPLVDDKHVYCLVGGTGSVAVAFDKRTGEEAWKALTAEQTGYAPPTMIEAGGTRQLLIFHGEGLASLDPDTGKVYWTEPLRPDHGMSIAAPQRDEQIVFFGGTGNKSKAVKLASDSPEASLLWEGNRTTGIDPINSTPFAEDGYLYGIGRSGELTCVELETGEHLWSTAEPVSGERPAGSGTAFLVKQNDRFFIFNELGDLIIARLSPEGYEELDRTHLIEPTYSAFNRAVVWSHPAFAERCVFVRNEKELICVSLAKNPSN